MTQITDVNEKKAAVAEQLRVAVWHVRQARDFVAALLDDGTMQFGIDAATIIALCPPLTAAAARLEKELDPRPRRRSSKRARA